VIGAPRRCVGERRGAGGRADALVSPIQDTVLRVAVTLGAMVDEGTLIAVIQAMKMENEIPAHKTGKVAELPIAVGASGGHRRGACSDQLRRHVDGW
jgi:acetyl-CoA/propionyl-CoA carboxylase biotin carboxyl carrier protein